MDKNFVLIIKYESGENAFLTNTPNLQEALTEYTSALVSKWNNSLSKNCGLPEIKEAKIIKLWK